MAAFVSIADSDYVDGYGWACNDGEDDYYPDGYACDPLFHPLVLREIGNCNGDGQVFVDTLIAVISSSPLALFLPPLQAFW